MNRLDSMKRVMDITNRSYISGTHELGDIYNEMLAFAIEMGKVKEIVGYFFGSEYMKGSSFDYPGLQTTEAYDKQVADVLQYQSTLTQGRTI